MKMIKIRGYKGIYLIDEGNRYEVDQDGYFAGKSIKHTYKLLFKVSKQKDGKRIWRKRIMTFKSNTGINTAAQIALQEKIELSKKMGDDKDRIKIEKEVREKIDEMTLNDAFEAYITKRRMKEKTRYDFIKFYDKHIRHRIGFKRLEKVDSYDIQSVIDALSAQKYAKRTLLYVINTLNPMFKYYMTLKKIKENPCDFVPRLGKLDNEKEIILTDEEKKRLMNSIRNYPIEPYRSIFVFLSYGRRLSEVLKMEWEHINEKEGYYVVPKENSKNSKEMFFPLTSELIEALSRQEKRSKYVFPSITNPEKQMDKGTLKRHWKKILKDAKIEKFRIHDLRHLIGNTLVSEGATLEEIAAILGHSSTTVTRRYAKADLESKRRTLEKFKKLVG